MKRKLTFAITAVALASMLIIGGTLAWFTDTKAVTNTASFRSVGIDLSETYTKTTDGKTDGSNVVDQINTITNWVPGDTLNKIPTVKNMGNTALLLKATITYSGDQFNYENKKENLVTAEELKAAIEKSGDWQVSEISKDNNTIVAYKLSPLAEKGASADADKTDVFQLTKLFDGNKYDNDIAQDQFKIIVKVEGIQAANIATAFTVDTHGKYLIKDVESAFKDKTIKPATKVIK